MGALFVLMIAFQRGGSLALEETLAGCKTKRFLAGKMFKNISENQRKTLKLQVFQDRCSKEMMSISFSIRKFFFVCLFLNTVFTFTVSMHLCVLSHYSCVWLLATPWTEPTRFLCPRDSPGKKTGVDCHFLFQEKGKAFLSLSAGDGKDYPLQYSGLENTVNCIVHGVAKSPTWLSDFHCSRESSWPKDRTHISYVSCIGRWVLYH